jgi:hypothetical protein
MPVLIVQSNELYESAIRTSICATITSNKRLAGLPVMFGLRVASAACSRLAGVGCRWLVRRRISHANRTHGVLVPATD